MKTVFNRLTFLGALVALTLTTISCGGDDEPEIDPPIASFTFAVDAENPLNVNFTNSSKDGETYAWDFGDESGTSTDENPSYTYADGGAFNVTLTVTNEGGTDETTKEVVVEEAPLIVNGDFADDSGWTIQQFNAYANADVTIADGVLTISEVNPDAAWGAEAHGGVWQAVTVEAGTYQLDLDITVEAADELWAEVWIGSTEPAADDDYNTADGATVVLALNTWDCGAAQATYSGSLADNYCDTNPDDGPTRDGKITLEAGTYYVVIRSGGITFPAAGVIIDNVSMIKVD